MKYDCKISALQFFLMLFLSRIVVIFSLNAQTVGEGNFLDHILSSIFLVLILLLFAVPFYRLDRRFPNQSLPTIAQNIFGNTGKTVAVLYILYFIYMNIISLSLFLTLVVNTMNPAASRWSIAVVLIAVALFGAVKGIETISRASICIFFLFISGFAIIFLALVPYFRIDYAEPLLSDGVKNCIRGFLFFFSRCPSLAELALLLPYVRKRKYINFTCWNVGVTLFVSVLLIFVVCTLGKYSYFQIFPVYTLSTMAEIAGIQRLDALLIGLSMMTLVVRLSCGLFAIKDCFSILTKQKHNIFQTLLPAFITLCASLWITEDSGRTGLLFRIIYVLPFTIFVSVLIPIFVWLASYLKRKRPV